MDDIPPQFPTETLIEQAFGRPAARFMSTSIPILIASSRAAQRHTGLNFTTLDTPSQQSLSGWLWLLPLVTYGKQSIMSMTTLSQSTDDVGSQEEEETAAAERAKVEMRDSTHTRLAIVVVVVEEEGGIMRRCDERIGFWGYVGYGIFISRKGGS